MFMSGKLKYGNWIRKKNLWLLGLGALGMGFLAFLPLPIWLRVSLGSLCVILVLSFLYPLYAYVMFSPQGGNMQEKIYTLIILSLQQPIRGKILDIGTGNGILAVKLAQCFPDVQVTGLDYWGRDWEYAKSVCEENARIASVAERVYFAKGDAAALDFANGEFDAIVSNLTFHEVKSIAQKGDVVKEALRALKPGGVFAFVDYFYERQYYGQISNFEALLESLGLSKITLKPLDEVLTIPAPLRHPKALGKVGILYGQK
jgi:SAM-dependent methyltransferase